MNNASQKIPDGGSAFPSEQQECADGTWNQTFDPGMSLRDYFAAKALPVTALQMNEAVLNAEILGEGSLQESLAADQFRLAAGLAYKYADAMLAERAKATTKEGN